MGGEKMEVDGKIESARIAIATSGVILYGMTLNEWVAVFTIIYLVFQILVLLPKIITGGRNLCKRLCVLVRGCRE
jgi:hypothetical protein